MATRRSTVGIWFSSSCVIRQLPGVAVGINQPFQHGHVIRIQPRVRVNGFQAAAGENKGIIQIQVHPKARQRQLQFPARFRRPATAKNPRRAPARCRISLSRTRARRERGGHLRGDQTVLGQQRLHGVRLQAAERPGFRLRVGDFLGQIFRRPLQFDVAGDQLAPRADMHRPRFVPGIHRERVRREARAGSSPASLKPISEAPLPGRG